MQRCILLLCICLVTIIVDMVSISSYKVFPLKPDSKVNLQQDNIYYELVNGSTEIDWSRLDATLEFINKQPINQIHSLGSANA